MILRGIHIEHWRCIAKLDIHELPDGIVVLHGPNRTGKSSLVRALRGCLFDFDHNSGSRDLEACRPHNGSGPPKVVIEFETGEQLHRLTKVFAKTKDGLARLEKRQGEKWHIVEDTPKEASRRVRELLKTDNSSAGLNQLLWLDQGVTGLPKPRDLDGSLEKRLVDVLGLMVTGRDLTFKQRLDNGYGRWFGVRGSHKPSSPVTELQNRAAELKGVLGELQAKANAVNDAIQAQEDCEARLPALAEAVAKAKSDVEVLEAERASSRERRQQYQQAALEVEVADEGVKVASKNWQRFEEAKGRWQTAEQDAVRADAKLQLSLEARDRAKEQHTKTEAELHDIGLAEEALQRARARIEDCRKLYHLEQLSARLATTLERAGDLQRTIGDLEEKLGARSAPDEATIKMLRENRRQAGELRAQLQAGALMLSVTSQGSAPFALVLDSQETQNVDLQLDERRSWSLLQRVRLEFPRLGIIEVARGQEDVDLERAAQQRVKLDRDYHETVLSFQEQPEEEACLDRLVARRVEHEVNLRSLTKTRGELAKAAPEGLGALERELEKVRGQRRIILERRPDLTGWNPDEEDITTQENELQTQARQLQATRASRAKADQEARNALNLTETACREARDQAVAARTTATLAQTELQRLGDALSLQAALKQAEQDRECARLSLESAQLTEAEKTIDQRLGDAKQALKIREHRLHAENDQMHELRGRLMGSEGLHPALADAEAAVLEADKALARETLEAEAHRRLRDLFEQNRDNQVQQVMGPIGSRVLSWAQALGLSEYREVRFGDHYLPDAVVMRNGAGVQPSSLEDESYGTNEQLSLLVRLALGGVLARDEPVVAIFDDPLAHADPIKHRRILDVLRTAAEGNVSLLPPAGRLQILILTCHPDRFDYLTGAHHIDLAKKITREA